MSVVIGEAAKDGRKSIRRQKKKIEHEHTVPITLQIGNQTKGSAPFGR